MTIEFLMETFPLTLLTSAYIFYFLINGRIPRR